jgi:peptide/nickel transport system permease protein
MPAYILNRFIQGLIVIIIASILVFLVMRLLPGDPIMLYLSQANVANLGPEAIEALRVKFGLDKPMPQQYLDWMSHVLRGDFGMTIFRGVTVGKLLTECFPVTAYLGILAVIFSTVVAVTAGLICALRRGSWIDTVVTSLANVGISAPVFWMGILMIYLFSLNLGWLPTNGYTSPFTDFWLSTKKLIMPVFCLSVVSLSFITRQTRSSVLEIIRQDYIRTAWAKGLRERSVVIRHILKNSLIPIATLIGMQVTVIFGGSVLVETVFNIPGVGRMMVDAVFNKDYPIVQGGALIIAVIVVATNVIVDISYCWLDPRIRHT